MVGNNIYICGVHAKVLAVSEYTPYNYVAVVEDRNSRIRVAYFTANDNDALLTDAELLPEFFADANKALEYGLRYV